MNSAWNNWVRALRAYSFAATVIPVLCAFLYARAAGETVAWIVFPLTLLCALLLHAGVNLLNDYYDFILGFDTQQAVGSSGLLTEGIVEPAYMLRWGRFYLACAAAAGLMLSAARGWPLFAAGLAGFAGAWFYSHRRGYKYMGLGEPLVFVLMGPLLFGAAHYAACGRLTLQAVAVSLPFGCLVSAILLVNNIRDLVMDGAAGFRTLPARIGARTAQRLYAGLAAAAFLLPAACAAAGVLTPWSLLSLAALPAAARAVRTALKAEAPFTALANAPQKTAAVYLLYGAGFAAGLFIGG